MGVNDVSLQRVEDFTRQARSSKFARKMTLFYLSGARYVLRSEPPAPKEKSADEILEVVDREEGQDRQVRDCIGDLSAQTGVEFQVHLHHEHLSGNDGEWSDLHRQLKLLTDPQKDERRLHYLLDTELARLRLDTGLPLEKWAFVHGMWALNGSDRSVCKFDNEIEILMQHGGWGDFSFPAGRRHCDPVTVEQPYTCVPVTAAKGYDLAAAKPIPIDVGAGAIRDGRFLIWNSKAKHTVCSLDNYDPNDQRRLHNADRIVFSWLSLCPVIDHTLYIKTHAHSMDARYFGEGMTMPFASRDVQVLFDLLQSACDAAKVELKAATVDEVLHTLRGVDGRGRSASDAAATSALDPASFLDMGVAREGEVSKLERPSLSVTEAISLALAKDWVSADVAHEQAAASYYLTRLSQGRFFPDSDMAIAEYSRCHFDSQTRFCELGAGLGELSVLLALDGFRVTGFEGHSGRYGGAKAITDALRVRGLPLDDMTLIEGLFPSALQLAAVDAKSTVLVATNVTSVHVMANIDRIYRAFGLFDHLIIDVAKFGDDRDAHAQQSLLADLKGLGFVDLGQVFGNVRHFRRAGIEVKEPSMPSEVRPAGEPSPAEPSPPESPLAEPSPPEPMRYSDLEAAVPWRLMIGPHLIFTGREVEAEAIFPRLAKIPKAWFPKETLAIQAFSGPSIANARLPSFEKAGAADSGRFVFPDFGTYRIDCGYGTFKCLLLDPALGRDNHALQIFRFAAENIVHSCNDKAIVNPWAGRPGYVRPDLLLHKLFQSDQPLALHCDHAAQVTAYLLHLNGFDVREIWLGNKAGDPGHVVMEVFLPQLEKWVMLDADFGVIVTDLKGEAQSTAEIASTTERRSRLKVKQVVPKHWPTVGFNTGEGYSGQRSWSFLMQAHRPTVLGDSYCDVMDHFFVLRREVEYRFADGFENNRIVVEGAGESVFQEGTTGTGRAGNVALPAVPPASAPADGELRWVERLNDLLIPLLRQKIERDGIKKTGASNYYGARVDQGRLFQGYEIALAQKILSSGLGVHRIDELGSGFGQLVFLLGWNGFETFGIESDTNRIRMAKTLREALELADPELTKNINLLEGAFPGRNWVEPGDDALLVTTNVVVMRTGVDHQLSILKDMRKYPLVICDIQRFFEQRLTREKEEAGLALFAQAGFGEPELFLDLGAHGKYYLFNSPR